MRPYWDLVLSSQKVQLFKLEVKLVRLVLKRVKVVPVKILKIILR